jgi:hypothetical protein
VAVKTNRSETRTNATIDMLQRDLASENNLGIGLVRLPGGEIVHNAFIQSAIDFMRGWPGLGGGSGIGSGHRPSA